MEKVSGEEEEENRSTKVGIELPIFAHEVETLPLHLN